MPRTRGSLRIARLAGAMALLCVATRFQVATAFAQTAAMLDDRVTQRSVADTICKPGYADTVAPPLSEMMSHKNQLLAQRGIDPDEGTRYALDRRVPIVLGGSPDAPGNLDLLPWAGHAGERRKELLAVKLKRCVCVGRMSLADAQATIAGDWPAHYANLGRLPCEDDRTGTTSSTDDAASH